MTTPNVCSDQVGFRTFFQSFFSTLTTYLVVKGKAFNRCSVDVPKFRLPSKEAVSRQLHRSEGRAERRGGSQAAAQLKLVSKELIHFHHFMHCFSGRIRNTSTGGSQLAQFLGLGKNVSVGL